MQPEIFLGLKGIVNFFLRFFTGTKGEKVVIFGFSTGTKSPRNFR